MRDLIKVINELIAQIPTGEHQYLVESLNSVQRKCAYTAPEMIVEHWWVVAEYLNCILGEEIDTEWKQNIADIFSDKKNKEK